jgi:hypothetical protein
MMNLDPWLNEVDCLFMSHILQRDSLHPLVEVIHSN